MSILTNLGQFTQFNILDHVQNLEVIRETLTEIEVHCPLCHAKNFKIDKKTGRYYGFSCSCMDTEQGKNEIVKEIAPLPEEHNHHSPRPQAKLKAQEPSFDMVEPINLAKSEVIPTDFPQPSKPLYLPQGIPENAHQIDYRYSPTQFVSRFDWEDPSKAKGCDKSFRQCHVNQEGNLIWGKGSQPWPLYHESEVIAAKDWILFQEGEKCVDAARSLGLVSTTLQGSNWGEEAIAESLTRLKEAGLPGVVFVTDNDGTGRDKGKKVALVGSKIDFPVIVIHTIDLWPECPEKGDLADWITWGIAKGMNIQDFIERLETEIHAAVKEREKLSALQAPLQLTKGQKLKLEIKAWQQETDIAERETRKVEICCQFQIGARAFDAIAHSLELDYSQARHNTHQIGNFMGLPTKGTPILAPGIPAIGVTILAGLPGTGKTTLAYDLAGAVLMGDEFLGEIPTQKGSVLFLACDEPYAHVQDKFINRGIANVESHLGTIITDWTVREWDALESTVDKMRPSLVVVDSFNGIHEDDNFDENSATAANTIKNLEKLSSRYSVPIVVIHHINKSKESRGVNKLRGSSAIAASCSSILILEGTEGNYKTLSQPKIRGSEPINLTLEADFEFGRFKVVSGNLADDNTKSLAERVHNFFLLHPGSLFEMTELRDHFPNEDRKVLTNSLNRLVNRGQIIKRPSKTNLRSKVYGIERTDNYAVNDLLSPPPIKPLKEFDDNISQTIDIKGIEPVITLSSPPENSVIIPVISEEKEMVTEDVMTSKTIAETEIQLDVINFDPQPRGGVPHISDDQNVVLIKTEESTTINQDNIEPLEWNDVIEEMDSCIEALGWTKERARQYVQVTYGKKSRIKLTDDELLELLEYFRNLVRAKE